MSRGHHALLFVAAVLACISCGDDDSASAGAAGASETGGEATAGKPGVSFGNGGAHDAGAAGAPRLSGVGGEAGGSCQGDAESWASITATAPACKTADDCCIVVNSCLAEAQVVGAKDYASAEKAWPYCAEDCSDCIPPAVIVACENGHCVGTADPDSGDQGVSHCGDVTPLGDDTAQSFSCQ